MQYQLQFPDMQKVTIECLAGQMPRVGDTIRYAGRGRELTVTKVVRNIDSSRTQVGSIVEVI